MGTLLIIIICILSFVLVRSEVVWRIRNELSTLMHDIRLSRDSRIHIKKMYELYTYNEMVFMYPLYWTIEDFYIDIHLHKGKF